MKKSNIYKIWIIFSLIFDIIYSSQENDWVTLVNELNPTLGYSNWNFSGIGDWRKSSKACSDYYGDRLETSTLQRKTIDIPKCQNLKISLDICLYNSWEDNDKCKLEYGKQVYKFDGTNRSNDNKLHSDIIKCNTVVNLEYQCKSGCDSCDLKKECICIGKKKILYETQTCGDCLTNKGFYIEQDNCKPCFSGCLSCQNSDQSSCNSCEDGYFLEKNKCSQCHSTCKTCIGSSISDCTKCSSSLLIQTNKQCGTCKSNEYNDGVSCFVCPDECKTCTNKNLCTSCSQGFFLRGGYACVGQCAKDEFVNEKNECQKCHQSCKTCAGSEDTKCTSCAESVKKILEDSQKCSTCDTQNGYYISGNYCLKCYKGCKTCSSHSEAQCQSCENSFYFDKLKQTCTPCHTDCSECNGIEQNQCSQCKSGKFLSLKDRICSDCNSNEYNDGKSCQLCSEKCSTCLSKDKCTSCSNNLYFRVEENNCVDKCLDNEFVNQKQQCQICDKKCKTCSGPSPTECKLCSGDKQYVHSDNNQCDYCDIKDGFFINNENKCEKCDTNCLECSGKSSAECKVCSDGYFLADKKCTECHPNCSTCTGDGEDKCQKCKQSGYYVSFENHKCQQGCKIGQYINENLCSECPKECNECESVEKCKSCKSPYYFRESEGKCVDQCKENEFKDGEKCQPCHTSCKSCTGSQKTECTACIVEKQYIISFKNNICGSCDIDNGQYIDDQTCKECNEKCKKCNGDKLENCLECKDSNYFDSISKTCEKCHAKCSGCTGPSEKDCTQCAEYQKFITKDQTCGNCNSNEYADNFKCTPCNVNCTTCESKDKCNTCQQGKYFKLKTNECVDKCDSNEFQDDTNFKCISCHDSCKECSGDKETDCKICKNDNQFVHEDNKICSNCDEENGYYISETKTKCLKCKNQNCKKCDKTNTCLVCDDQHYLFDSECMKCHEDCEGCTGGGKNKCKKCKNGKFISIDDNTCKVCNSNEYNDQIQCKKCPMKCNSCISEIECKSCNEPYYFQPEQQSCQDKCNDGYYNNKNICEKCDKTCSKCEGPTDCTSCSGIEQYVQKFNQNKCGECDIENGYIIQEFACLKCQGNCKKCKGLADTDCLVCGENYYLDEQKKTCQLCHEDCLTCTGPGELNCKRCKGDGKFLSTKDNSCQVCQPSEYDDQTKCILCPPQCTSCKNDKICTGCAPNFYFRPEEGICVQECHPEEYASKDNKCIRCHEQCKTCSGESELECLQCSDENKFRTSKDNKCGTCEPNEFINQETYQCEKCHQDCQTCSGPNKEDCTSCSDSSLYLCSNKSECDKSCLKCHEGCDQCFGEQLNQCKGCSVGILQSDNTCQKKCPEFHFYDEQNNSCQVCVDYCKKCDNTSTCLECDTSDPQIQMYKDKCYNCSLDQFFDKEKLQCIDCNSECKTCSSTETCLTCKDLEFILEGKCYKVCPDKFIGDIKDSKCAPCKYENGVCVLSCSNSYYLEGDQCLKCQDNCAKCDSKDTCKECINNSALKEVGKISYCHQCDLTEYVFELKQCKKCIDKMPQCQQCSDQGYRCTLCNPFYEVNIMTGMCEVINEGCTDADDCQKQKDFKEKIDQGVKYANQAAGTLQFALIFTQAANTPFFWYWSQSYQHIGNYDIYENDFKSYGLGSIYLRSLYKSYNVFPYLPQVKIFNNDENSDDALNNNKLVAKRLLLKKQDLNWDSEKQQSLFNNLMYWSYLMIFIILIFLILKFIHLKNVILYKIYIKKEEYVTRFVLFTSNYILMQLFIGFQSYNWYDIANGEDILGFCMTFLFLIAYSFSFYRLYKQSINQVQKQQQEYTSLFDRYLIKIKRRYKYFWIVFEIRKILVILAFCLPKDFLISSICVLSLDILFCIYLIFANPFTDRYTIISIVFQESAKVTIDILLLLCYELTEFKSKICFGIVIFLMFLNFINLVFVVFLIIKYVLEYIKNRKNREKDNTSQELTFLNITDLINDKTNISTMYAVEKKSSFQLKSDLISFSRGSINPIKYEQMKRLKYKNETLNYSLYTKEIVNKTFEKV